jgi:hypothetical protein
VKTEVSVSRIRRFASAIGVALLGAAIVEELRKPAARRVWHGHLWGRVPYEFRLPTMDRIRYALWAPEDKRLFTDTAFGVGWSLNLGRLLHACSKSQMPSIHRG